MTPRMSRTSAASWRAAAVVSRESMSRERPVELLMNALYRTGRSSDALLAFAEARHRIADAMGADPGPALRSLHERMLRQDPELLSTRTSAAPVSAA